MLSKISVKFQHMLVSRVLVYTVHTDHSVLPVREKRPLLALRPHSLFLCIVTS